ncbi:hypothetical protein [Methanosarcina sp. DH2]|jgi:hypothetical protein|nr:hypothetical protein [Methanosarcina sp. DH2]
MTTSQETEDGRKTETLSKVQKCSLKQRKEEDYKEDENKNLEE